MRDAPDSSKFSHLTEKEMPITASETELPLGETATAEGINSIPLVFFNHVNIVLTPIWLTFAQATATAEGDTSSNIAKMIEELTQPDGAEVPKISVEETLANTTGATGRIFSIRKLAISHSSSR